MFHFAVAKELCSESKILEHTFFNAVAIFTVIFFMAQDAILEKKGRGMELNCLANSSEDLTVGR